MSGMIRAADSIRLDDARTATTSRHLADKGCLTPERKSEMLTN